MKRMNKVFKIFLLLALLGLGYWLWTVLFPNPQQVIRNRLNKLASLASFSSDDGNISRVAKIQRLGALFADNVQITIDVPGVDAQTFTSREELKQAALAAKRFTSGLKAEFLDMNIELDDAAQSALVDLTLKAKVAGESDLIVQELKFTLKKINGDWLITRVETVKTLKP
jgi:hypothetical protein